MEPSLHARLDLSPDNSDRADRAVDRCWASIGVRGDGTCPDLPRYVHCRNCPVYSTGAQRLLDRDLSADDLVRATSHIATPLRATAVQTNPVVVFRVGSEWLALPAACVIEAAVPPKMHALPHRTGGAVVGLANVRGELLIAVSLGQLLGIGVAGQAEKGARQGARQRVLVLRREGIRAVCPVDEVHGIHRLEPRDLNEVPSTVGKTGTLTKAVFAWDQHSVGLLDAGLLFQAIGRSAA